MSATVFDLLLSTSPAQVLPALYCNMVAVPLQPVWLQAVLSACSSSTGTASFYRVMNQARQNSLRFSTSKIEATHTCYSWIISRKKT